MIWTSRPIEIGPGGLPDAIHVINTKRDIAAAIGRKGLLGHRGPSLVTLAAADLARTQIYRADQAAIVAAGVVTVAPRASTSAVREVCTLVAEGRSRAVSILDAPNVSPNVTSAAASIRLGARGPAFTIDSRTGGVRNAWHAASAMIIAGRCPSVLVVEVVEVVEENDESLSAPGEDELPVAVAAVLAGAESAATPFAVAADPFVGRGAQLPATSALAALWTPVTAVAPTALTTRASA